MKNLKLVLISAMITLLFGCVNGDDYGTPDLSSECVTIAKTKEVSDITGIATSTATQYTTTDNIDYIEAYVTSSDEGGNFFKSISMVSTNGSIGFSMPVDNYNLYTEFEPGRKVTIKLDKNRYFNRQFGSTVLGSSFNNGVGRISSVEYKDVILRSCDKVDEETLVNKITIAQAKNDQNLNKLIEFENVQFTDPSLGKKYYDPTLNTIGGATNHTITDNSGNTVIVRISEFATFAGDNVLSGSGKIRGVLTKFNSDYQFMIRTTKDINLTGTRFDAFPPIVGSNIVYSGAFSENFESYTAGSASTGQRNFPRYINDAYQGTKYWYVASFSGNKYLVMSAFNSSTSAQDQNNKTYFIMPVDFTAANSMSFKSQDRFNNGSVLRVYYSTNYTPGGDIANATLTNITSNFTIASGTTTGTTVPFVNSGVYNFPAGLTGNGFIIFEYTGGYSFNPDLTTTIHLDDIVIN
ncbi:MAG: DUF5689 domain-containing protein [Flavobacterium sp.]